MIVLLLMLLEVIIPVTSRLNSVTVMSYMKGRKVLGGDVMCALNAAFETISSSSLQNCSYKCGYDATCIGFNIKNSLTCDVYTRKPAITSPVSGCIFYQVGTVSTTTGMFRGSLRLVSPMKVKKLMKRVKLVIRGRE